MTNLSDKINQHVVKPLAGVGGKTLDSVSSGEDIPILSGITAHMASFADKLGPEATDAALGGSIANLILGKTISGRSVVGQFIGAAIGWVVGHFMKNTDMLGFFDTNAGKAIKVGLIGAGLVNLTGQIGVHVPILGQFIGPAFHEAAKWGSLGIIGLGAVGALMSIPSFRSETAGLGQHLQDWAASPATS